MKRGEPLQRKRTLSRGKTKLKRSRLNRVSKKNSQPHRDKGIVDEYRKSHKSCAWCGSPHDPLHVHHIFCGARSRVDDVANLLVLCGYCHLSVHEKPVEGKIRCLHCKLELGELDAESLSRISGERLIGWLSRQRVAGGADVQRERLVQTVEGGM